MRHKKAINHLGRKDGHRKAMLANMASSLIMHKRINTTVAKAKALKTYVEPLITKSKEDTTHSRRTVFSYLKNKEAVRADTPEYSTPVSVRVMALTWLLSSSSTSTRLLLHPPRLKPGRRPAAAVQRRPRLLQLKLR